MAEYSKLESSSASAKIALILSVIAVLVSAVGTCTSLQQTKIQREQKSASVWPHVQMQRLEKIEGQNLIYSLRLVNKGIGPALMGEIALKYNEELANPANFSDLLNERHPELDAKVVSYYFAGGTVLAPEEEVDLCVISIPFTEEKEELIYRVIREMRDAFCYCSVYRECWQVNYPANYTPGSACEQTIF